MEDSRGVYNTLNHKGSSVARCQFLRINYQRDIFGRETNSDLVDIRGLGSCRLTLLRWQQRQLISYISLKWCQTCSRTGQGVVNVFNPRELRAPGIGIGGGDEGKKSHRGEAFDQDLSTETGSLQHLSQRHPLPMNCREGSGWIRMGADVKSSLNLVKAVSASGDQVS